MSNFVRDFVLLFLGLFFFSWLISLPIRWRELSTKYKVEQGRKSSAFLINQVGGFKSDRGTASIKGLIIGISDEGLHLAVPSPIEVFFPSLLIPWTEITYQKVYNSNFRQESIVFHLGNPTITSLTVDSSAIEKLEKEYGEPIFSNKLGELN
ncbi:MAG: hypothetical protein AAF383_17805 [Cyanobacteria bacterium P01_A01_bin.83]